MLRLIFIVLLILPVSCTKAVSPIPSLFLPTPTPVCGFIKHMCVGCKKDGLTVFRSSSDWDEYLSLSGCGTANTEALAGFDFDANMVVLYSYSCCKEFCSGNYIKIQNVCEYKDKIVVYISIAEGDAIVKNPDHKLAYCNQDAVVIPQSDKPVETEICRYNFMQLDPPCQKVD
jgi:hypothetical protein